MAKLPNTKSVVCDLCNQAINKSLLPTSNQQELVNYLWNYFYHKNVKEALSPSATLSPSEENEDSSKIPRLTFSLTMGKSIGTDKTKTLVNICNKCDVELQKLDKLHHQLESVKSLINCQMDTVIKRCQSEASHLNPEKSRTVPVQPPSGLVMGGCSIGKENISQMLHFLSTICEGISSSPPASQIQMTELENSTVKIRTPNDTIGLANETRNDELDESLSNGDPDIITEVALDVEVGEEFVSIIKIEADVSDEGSDDEMPELDPQQYTAGQKSVKSTVKTAKKVVCTKCNKNVFEYNLETHMKWHAGEKQFKCELCTEGFTTKGNLHRHSKWHQKELWEFKCDGCGKRFLHNYRLVSHQKEGNVKCGHKNDKISLRKRKTKR